MKATRNNAKGVNVSDPGRNERIVIRIAEGGTLAEVAEEFGLKRATVSNIVAKVSRQTARKFGYDTVAMVASQCTVDRAKFVVVSKLESSRSSDAWNGDIPA